MTFVPLVPLAVRVLVWTTVVVAGLGVGGTALRPGQQPLSFPIPPAVADLAPDPVPLPRAVPIDLDWDYQLGGASAPPDRVGVVVRDRTEEPADADYDVCYVNAFQTHPDARAFWRRHADLVLHRGGRPCGTTPGARACSTCARRPAARRWPG